jgi:hypothetical protein
MQNTLLPAVLISLCALVSLFFLLRGLQKALARTSWDQRKKIRVFRLTYLWLGAWILLLGILSLNGFFSDFSRLPPRLPFVVLIPLPAVLFLSSSASGRELLRSVPPQWIIYLQSFRIVVEIVLWLAVLRALLPVQMSFEGRNFDVFSGLLAVPVGYYCLVKKAWPSWMVLVYNILGLLLLLNIVAIAVLSMPTPLRAFHNEPANTLIVQFPFIFLPGLLVPLAYTLHIFSLRQWAAGIR